MLNYGQPNPADPLPSAWQRHRVWLIPLLILDLLIVIWWLWPDNTPSASDLPAPELAAPLAAPAVPPPPPGLRFGYPTAQNQLLDTNSPGIYMPTASGRPESAMYGSVRSTKQGKFVLPSFHEGLDIGPMNRDRKNMPTDLVIAAADGRVAYANRIAGNSNYGKYVVLVHDDPTMGEIYTLYAHLADVDPAMRPGAAVTRGQTLGLMGNSASTGIPVVRAHLHFEVGVINNSQFHRWFKAQKLKPDHGNYHGHNLTGIHPLDVFQWQLTHETFGLGDYLDQLAPAFTLVAKTPRPLNYFARYPSRWTGEPATTFVMTVSEGGVPLRGRPATEDERRALAGKRHHILSVDEAVLGRNGLRLVTRKQGNWILGKNGERWLEILAYH
jgi:murein DD-endopeptidase MepM/ murein hydrolase activator NlpD